jgi:hypothetical protein
VGLLAADQAGCFVAVVSWMYYAVMVGR